MFIKALFRLQILKVFYNQSSKVRPSTKKVLGTLALPSAATLFLYTQVHTKAHAEGIPINPVSTGVKVTTIHTPPFIEPQRSTEIDQPASQAIMLITKLDKKIAEFTQTIEFEYKITCKPSDIFPFYLGSAPIDKNQAEYEKLERTCVTLMTRNPDPAVASAVLTQLRQGIPQAGFLYCPIETQMNKNMVHALPIAVQWLIDKHFFSSHEDPKLKKFLSHGFNNLVAKTYRKETSAQLVLALLNVFLLFLHDDLRDARESIVGKSMLVDKMNTLFRTIFNHAEHEKSPAFIRESILPLQQDFETALEQSYGESKQKLTEKMIVRLLSEAYIDFSLNLRASTSATLFREFKTSMESYFKANAWEAENRVKKSTPDLISYQHNRASTSGVHPVFDMGGILRGISRPEVCLSHTSIGNIEKDNFLSNLDALNTHALNHIVFVNDLASFVKEEKEGVCENLVTVYRHAESSTQRTNLVEASLDLAVSLTNHTLVNFSDSVQKATETIDNWTTQKRITPKQRQDLLNYIEIRQDWVRGNLGWSFGDQDLSPSLRYGCSILTKP